MRVVKKLRRGLSWLLLLSASCSAFAVTTASSASNSSKAKTVELEQADAVNPTKTASTAATTIADSTTNAADATNATNATNTTNTTNTADTVNTVELDEANATTADPYERFNRIMFQFNEVADRLVIKPVATLYIKIIPKPLSKGLSNFYNNIDTIPTVANDFLQANFYQGTSDAWRLTLNSTVGILGFFDVASSMGLEPNKEDFGLTLAQWGYRNSNYLVLPFLGPGTVRDQIGWPINYYFLTIYPYIYPVAERNELYLTGLVVKRAELLRYQNVLAEASLDDYTFIRNAYMQRRAYQLERNAELSNPYAEKNKQSEQGSISHDDQDSISTAEQSSPSTDLEKNKKVEQSPTASADQNSTPRTEQHSSPPAEKVSV